MPEQSWRGSAPPRAAIRLRRSAGVLPALLAAAFLPAPGSAQSESASLAADCAPDPRLEAPCLGAALGLRQVQGGIGILASGGADVPGSTSTLGRRFGTTPRFALSLRGGLARFHLPDIRSAPAPGRGEASTIGALQAQLAVGLFDGFSPVPTVGGVLSVDVVAGVNALFLPGDRGFDGTSTGLAFGVRVGVFRESFSLPGVTLSATRHTLGDLVFEQQGGDGSIRAELDPRVTSLRATVGKQLLGVGVLGGVGWDRTSGDARIVASATRGPAPDLRGEAVTDDAETERLAWFGGLSWNFLVLQVSAEGGWAEGLGPFPGADPSGFDGDDGSFFGSLSVRLTL